MNTSRKHKDFRKIINENRSILRQAGFKDAAVSRWASGQRVPSENMAIKLAYTLSVPLERIPHHLRIIV